MIFFLYGENTYLSRQKLEEIVAHYKETGKTGLNLQYIRGENLDFQRIKDEFQTISMFKEKKLFVITDIFGNEPFKEAFKKDIKRFVDSENTILFYEKQGGFSKDSFFTLLKKHAKSQEFEKLQGIKLKNWLKNEFEKAKARVGPIVLDALLNFAGDDLWQLSNEVQKLAAYKKGREIELKDVKALVKPKIENDIFKTIDAIALKNKKQALTLLHKHLEKGDSPLYLLSMITFQFRNILGVKDLAERKKPLSASGLHPFVARKSQEQARKFTYEELKKIYRKIFEVDYQIKTGKVEPQTALDMLVADLQ